MRSLAPERCRAVSNLQALEGWDSPPKLRPNRAADGPLGR